MSKEKVKSFFKLEETRYAGGASEAI